jgi:hypothetical protein
MIVGEGEGSRVEGGARGLFVDGMGLCRDESSDAKGNKVEAGSMGSSSKSRLGIKRRELE